MNVGFMTGIRCFGQGLNLAFSPAYRRFVLVPAAVSLVVIVLGLMLAFSFVNDAAQYLQEALNAWPEVVQWILKPLMYLIAILVGAWSFGFLATLIVSPFLGELSRRVYPEGCSAEQPWYREALSALGREARKLRYTLPRLLGLLLLGLIPVLNLVTPLLWLGFGAWLMAIQFADFPFENRARSFPDTLDTMRGARAATVGFGVCVTFGLSIPLINVIVAPVATIGGSLLVRRIHGA